MQPSHLHQVWGDPLAVDGADPGAETDEVIPPIVGDSSDEELWHQAGATMASSPHQHFDTDDELWDDEWTEVRRGTCRGEAENVLGREAWDPVSWAINTGNSSMDVDPSVHKKDRGSCEDPATCPMDSTGNP